MFFFLDIPKWFLGLMIAAVLTVIGVISWLVIQNLTPKGGAVEYLESYQPGAGKSATGAKRNPRDERKTSTGKGFELQPGMKPADTIIRKGEKGAAPTEFTPAPAAPSTEGGKGRGGRN